MVVGQLPSYGGEPITIVADLQEHAVCCGILYIHNLSGWAYRDLLRFRQAAKNLARAADRDSLILAGYEVINPQVAAALRDWGFTATTRPIPEELYDELGPGMFSMLVKVMSVC